MLVRHVKLHRVYIIMLTSTMKCIVFIVTTCILLVTTYAVTERDIFIRKLARGFSISTEEAEHCIVKTGVVEEDIKALINALTQEKILRKERLSVRRAACVITCASQYGGLMVGRQIQLHKVIDTLRQMSNPSPFREYLEGVIIGECYSQVQNIYDECDVSFAFMQCAAEMAENAPEIFAV